jgi:glycosyltransferase involved in cell wall biosynthesis
VRVLIDYRPALRERTGIGEYTHELVKALASQIPPEALDLTAFSSSWRDRLTLEDDHELRSLAICDRRMPVRLLNVLWHRLGWPSAEALTGRSFDVTHSPHPLLLPSRTAAQVITIHDLSFLDRPDSSRPDVRRDYPALVHAHAARADRIIVSSRYAAGAVASRLGAEPEKISLCPPGAPEWPPRRAAPRPGYLLFMGTIEPRKNVGVLLDAYERLLGRQTGVGHGANRALPELILAGKATEAARATLDRLERSPLRGVVRHLGYVDANRRRALYEGARLLVLPSLDEGFGLPVLEAMATGVPVIAASRGALPEVLGGAGPLIDPDRPDDLCAAIEKILQEDAFAADCVLRGLARAREFKWSTTAERVYDAYRAAVEHRRCASA